MAASSVVNTAISRANVLKVGDLEGHEVVIGVVGDVVDHAVVEECLSICGEVCGYLVVYSTTGKHGTCFEGVVIY